MRIFKKMKSLLDKYIKKRKLKVCVECGQTMEHRKHKYCSDLCQRKKYKKHTGIASQNMLNVESLKDSVQKR